MLSKARVANTIGWSIASIGRVWLRSLKIHYSLADEAVNPRTGAQGGLYCLWHEDLLTMSLFFADCGIHTLISNSKDGEYVSRMVEMLGFHPIRGSTGRGGLRAVREIIRTIGHANLAITPDGPRGPRREFQEGAIYLASRTGLDLIPVMAAYDRPWRFKSWDKNAVPRLGTKLVIRMGKRMHVPADANSADLKAFHQLISADMNAEEAIAQQLLADWKQGAKLETVHDLRPEIVRDPSLRPVLQRSA